MSFMYLTMVLKLSSAYMTFIQRVVLGGDVEQVLDCLGVCGVLVALHVQNNEIGFGNIRYAAPGLDQTFALELIGDQNRSASQRRNEFIFSVVH